MIPGESDRGGDRGRGLTDGTSEARIRADTIGVRNEALRATIAHRLRVARQVAGLSQGQIAKMMRMHRPTISEIEAARRRVAAEELAEFARHYRTSVGWITGEEPEAADPADDRIRLAARELAKLSGEDLDRVLRVLGTIHPRRSES